MNKHLNPQNVATVVDKLRKLRLEPNDFNRQGALGKNAADLIKALLEENKKLQDSLQKTFDIAIENDVERMKAEGVQVGRILMKS